MKQTHPWIARLSWVPALLLLTACSKPVPPPRPAAEPASVALQPSSPVQPADPPSADDLAVAARVKAAFQGEANLKELDIQVVSTKGDVRLSGQVDKADQKSRAIALARTLQGVHSIYDQIALKP
jgi:hypothetical protein